MSGLEPIIEFNFNGDGGDVEPMDIEDTDSPDSPKRETRNVMTKYEKTRIIGARATLLTKGAEPLVNTEGEKDLLKIAEKELYARKLPITITRKLPNGRSENWSVQELILPTFK